MVLCAPTFQYIIYLLIFEYYLLNRFKQKVNSNLLVNNLTDQDLTFLKKYNFIIDEEQVDVELIKPLLQLCYK
jgi:hypothetical protein